MTVVLLIVLGAGGDSLAMSSKPWVLVEQSEELKLWRREVPGSAVQEIKVEALIPVPAGALWTVLRDVPHYPDWMPSMAEARIIQEEGETRIVYQRINPPVGSDRDYTLRVVARVDVQTGVREQRLSIANDAGPPPIDGVIRVETLEGGWLLEPVGKGRTRLVYWLHTDPGGWIPAWAVRIGQSYSLPRQIEAMTRRAQALGEQP